MVMGAHVRQAEWLVIATDRPPVRVSADNWLAALGEGLAELGTLESLARLACERLANGRVLANDLAGRRYVVEPLTPARG